MRQLLSLLTMLVATTFPAHATEGFDRAVNDTISNSIRPAFAAYAERTASLVPIVKALCVTPSQVTLTAAQEAFSETLAAWSRIEFVRFGPMIVNDRLERTLFWPDPKGIGLKQVQKLLAEEDASALTADSLANKSVAVQGLAALEFTLFGSGFEALATGEPGFRCKYAAAIADNVDRIATELADEWQDRSLAILTPSTDNPAYRDQTETLLEVIQTLTTGFEAIANLKLRPVLGDSLEKARPRRAQFRRSQNTISVLTGNIDGLEDLIVAADLADFLERQQKDTRLVGSIEFEIANARRTLDGLDGSIETVAATEDGWTSLNYLAITMDSLRRTIGDRMTAELGLTLGFNSMDGD